MVIEKLHGLQSTNLSLNERFTMLQSSGPERVVAKPRRRQKRQSMDSMLAQNLNLTNQNLIEQITQRLQQSNRQTLRQRLGVSPGALRRFGSESSLPGLRRSNSFGNISQTQSMRSFTPQRYKGNMRRSVSFSNLWGGRPGAWGGRPGAWGGRRGVNKQMRGRYRGGGGRNNAGQSQGFRRGGRRGGARGRGLGRGLSQGQGRGLGRGLARLGQGNSQRGGAARQQQPGNQKAVPTKEELDQQLDEYMASSKYALDRELDAYMKDAMELE